MALVRFLRDFQGRATRETFYRAGEVADLETADAVVAEGAAEYVEVNTPEAPVAEPIRPKRTRKPKSVGRLKTAD